MPSAVFKPAIPAFQRLQNDALESKAAGIGIHTWFTLLLFVAA
jgi:hypothetical protein